MDGPGEDVSIYRQIIEATRDAVVFIDAGANIVRLNAAATQMFGLAPEQAVGRPVTVLMPEPYASEHASYVSRYERTKEPRAIGQIRHVMGRRGDGSRFPLELSVTEVGHPEVRYAAILRDISDRARVDRQLAEKERLAGVGLLATMFAHEVGNPLNNIFIHAQMLQRRLAKLGFDDEGVGANVRLIHDELIRLMELLHDFRELYQQAPMTLGPVSVVVVLEDVLRALMAESDDRAVELTTQLDPGLPPVLGNVNKLKQVFINLCKNAVEAMPEGGRLAVRACAREGRIEIEDSGSGMPDDLDPFAPFHTTKVGGSGLGLPVVRQIVSRHDGDVSFTSAPGRGTTFRITLPISS